MRATLVFPPALCFPNPIYYALPLLAGALRQGGHDVKVLDLNVLAADRLLTREWAERVLARAREEIEARAARGTRDAASRSERDRLHTLVSGRQAQLLEAPECKTVLRDPVRSLDPPSFRHAFLTIAEALDFYYLLDPVISPHRPSFAADVIDHVRRDTWSPLRDLYDEDLLGAVLATRPQVVGISVAFPEQAAESVRLAAKLKERCPGVIICFGGPLITLFSEKWLQDAWLFTYADAVVVGDGETALARYVDALSGRGRGCMEDVPNLVRLDEHGRERHATLMGHRLPMDELPRADFHDTDLSLYLTPEPIWPMMTSRGCYWGRCTFCSGGWREAYRIASPARIRADALDLARTYRARYVYVQDSSVPPRAALDLASAISEERLELFWMGGMKFEKSLLDPAYCRGLAAGGCRSLLLGLESASQRLLDLMDKGFRLADVPTMLRNLRQAGMSAELLWFLGFPSESPADVLRTVRFLLRHRDLFGLAAFVGNYQLHPDTKVYRRPQDFGVTIAGLDNDHCLYVSESGMQIEETERLKQVFTGTANRTLVCNGAHLPHLVENGLDLSGIEQPLVIPPEAEAYCSE